MRGCAIDLLSRSKNDYRFETEVSMNNTTSTCNGYNETGTSSRFPLLIVTVLLMLLLTCSCNTIVLNRRKVKFELEVSENKDVIFPI